LNSHNLKSWRNWFWHEQDNRLRAFWRILLAFVLFEVIARGIYLLFAAQTGNEAVSADTAPSDVARLLVLLVVFGLMAKYVDKRAFSDYGLKLKQKPFWVDFVFGLTLGSLMITAVFTVEYGLGWIEIVDTFVRSTDIAFYLALLLPLINLIAAAVFTELFFRGFLLVNLAESFNFLRVLYQSDPLPEKSNKVHKLLNSIYGRLAVLTAWLLTTFFFLLYLLYRTSDGMISNVFILNMLRASFLLTLPFILTRNLGVPIGLNLGWNFFANSVFGLNINELIFTKTSILAILVRGPISLTGGEAGPEAGLMGMGAIILGGFVVMAWVRYRQKQAPPDFDPWVFEYQPLEK
jgi:membrane protease YdiL (CAAX protease family)